MAGLLGCLMWSNFRTECPGPQELARNTRRNDHECDHKDTVKADIALECQYIYQESIFFSLLIRSWNGRSRIVSQHLSSGLPHHVFKVARVSVMKGRWTL